MNKHNPNTRALVSALRSDMLTLRKAAAEIVDKAIAGKERPALELQIKFHASRPTAYAILNARKAVTRSGARRKG